MQGFFLPFPRFSEGGDMGLDRRREAEGAGRRKAQRKSPGERDERRAGAGKGACRRVGRCCGETCGTESRAGTEVRRGKAICYFRARAASFAKLSVAGLPAAVFSGQVRHMCTLLSDCRERL